MAVIPKDVQALSLSGAFDELTDAQIQPRIDRAARFVNVAAWDIGQQDTAKSDDGVANLAAHFLTMDDRPAHGPGGVVVSESAGRMSRSYAGTGKAASLSEEFLMATTFGRTFLMCRRSLPLTPLTAHTLEAEGFVT